MSVADNSAVVFGASGAIGGAMAARLVAEARTVHAGVRGADAPTPPGTQRFVFDVDDESGLLSAAAAQGQPTLVMVATGLLHDAAHGIAPEKSLRALDGAAMMRLFAVNTVLPALIARHWLPRLPRDRRAVFAVLSARVGSIGDNQLGGWHGYRASKAALNMLVKTLSVELARTHPLATIVALHPGTVDSSLSAPFQRGVAPGRLFSPDQSAGLLLDVIEGLTPADSGQFIAWDGERLPW
jgi:NAD(P)-dependent dehydrogenase (short-subunit alcohol dehydrogenase family)